MKKFLIPCVVIISFAFFTSCVTEDKDKKASEMATQFILNHSDHPESYKPISFTPIYIEYAKSSNKIVGGYLDHVYTIDFDSMPNTRLKHRFHFDTNVAYIRSEEIIDVR